MTFRHLFASPIGLLSMKEEDGFITELSLLEAAMPPGSGKPCPPPSHSVPETELSKRTQEQLAQYFAGRRRTFELPVFYRGTPFRQRVWDAKLSGYRRAYRQPQSCPRRRSGKPR